MNVIAPILLKLLIRKTVIAATVLLALGLIASAVSSPKGVAGFVMGVIFTVLVLLGVLAFWLVVIHTSIETAMIWLLGPRCGMSAGLAVIVAVIVALGVPFLEPAPPVVDHWSAWARLNLLGALILYLAAYAWAVLRVLPHVPSLADRTLAGNTKNP